MWIRIWSSPRRIWTSYNCGKRKLNNKTPPRTNIYNGTINCQRQRNAQPTGKVIFLKVLQLKNSNTISMMAIGFCVFPNTNPFCIAESCVFCRKIRENWNHRERTVSHRTGWHLRQCESHPYRLEETVTA